MKKAKHAITTFLVGLYCMVAIILIIGFAITALIGIKKIIYGVTPDAIEWFGIAFISLIAGFAGAVWFYFETEDD